MSKIQWNRKPKSVFSFPHLSIQQRLPLLICILLLSVIIIFGLASYIGVKKAAFEIGRDRLYTLAEQLSSMLGQSVQTVIVATRAAAAQEPVKKYLQSAEKTTELDVICNTHINYLGYSNACIVRMRLRAMELD